MRQHSSRRCNQFGLRERPLAHAPAALSDLLRHSLQVCGSSAAHTRQREYWGRYYFTGSVRPIPFIIPTGQLTSHSLAPSVVATGGRSRPGQTGQPGPVRGYFKQGIAQSTEQSYSCTFQSSAKLETFTPALEREPVSGFLSLLSP